MSEEKSVIEEHFSPKRAGDFSLPTRIASFFLKYNWLMAILVAFFIAAGFGWRTPQSRFDELQTEIALTRAIAKAAIDSLSLRAHAQEENAAKMVDILEIFTIDLCLRRKPDPYVWKRLGCAKVVSESGIP